MNSEASNGRCYAPPAGRGAAPPVDPPRKGAAVIDPETAVEKMLNRMSAADRKKMEDMFVELRVTDPMDKMQVLRDFGPDPILGALK